MGSFNDEYLKLRKERVKKKRKKSEEEQSSVPYQRPLNNSGAVGEALGKSFNSLPLGDIAPVIPQKSEQYEAATQALKNKNKGWVKASELFEDGYDFGDVSKAILATGTDLLEKAGAGLMSMGEAALDTFAYIGNVMSQQQLGESQQSAMGMAVLTGKDPEKVMETYNEMMDTNKASTEEFIKKDLYNEDEIAKQIITQPVENLTGIDVYGASVSGDKLDNLAKSGGQLAGTYILTKLGVPWWLTTGTTSFGGEMDNALNQGATYEEAAFSGLVSAGAEILTEKAFGGSGLGEKGLINLEGVTKGISNKVLKTLADYGVDMASEGFEEVFSTAISAVGQKLSYLDEKEWSELLSAEELFDSFIGGAALSGVMNAGKATNSLKTGQDYQAGLTENEQKVFDKLYEAEIEAKTKEKGSKLTKKENAEIYDKIMNDLEKGYISIDTIEEVLGGEDYSSYQSELKRQQDIENELNELRNMKSGDMTDIQMERMAELKGMKPNTELVDSLKFSIDEKIRNSIQGTRLAESYNEEARRGQVFEADLTQYDSKQQEVIKKAIESGILNNTNRTHDFVDMVAKISADKGVLFDFANNAKLKESGFAVDGKFVNGFYNNGSITVNIDSNKAHNTIVGHEITHVLEGTDLYNELQKVIFEYAKSKGEYQDRFDTLTKLYEGVEGADVNAELTADLVGDYLFTDSDFINHLSTTNRNVFQKIYDEIKYLYKVATAGSKQARELEKVKRAFDKAYREGGKASGDTKYSLSEQKTPTYKDLVAKKPTRIINITKGIESGSYADMKAATMSKAKNEGWFDAPHHNEDTDSQIFLTEKSFTHAYSNLSAELGEDTIRCLAHIPEIIEEAVLVSVDDPRNNQSRETKVYTFFGAVEGVNGIEPVKLTVKEFDFKSLNSVPKNIRAYFENNGIEEKYSSLYDARALEVIGIEGIKKESDASVEGYAQGAQAQDTSDSTISIADLLKLVKGDAEKYIPKFSLSDSEGKQLTKEQSEYFKDSKMRDDNGNLKVMYHGSQDAGFHIFDANMSDDDTSLFFVDRNDVAASYSGTSETYEAQSIRTAEDMNNFIESIGAEDYEVIEKDGKFTLLFEGDRVAESDSAAGIYEEFCWYEGVGEGDANYKVYLNLVNPLVVDAKNSKWNDLRNWSKAAFVNAEVVEVKRVEGEFRLFNKNTNVEIPNATIAVNSYTENMSQDSLRSLMINKANNILLINTENLNTTRDVAKWAKENGYDGVIFKNIHDNGGYSNGSEGASTVAIAFESNQIKSVANDKPTADKDIRFSLSEAVEETKDLMALHNLKSNELLKSLDLGGLPMPSIAVIKAEAGHEQYGDVSLIFPKETIDPQANKDNKVYGGDAWTPTYPKIKYKPNDKVEQKISDKYYELANKYGYDNARSLYRYVSEMEDVLNEYKGEQALLEALYEDTKMMQAYLLDSGKGAVETVQKEIKTEMSDVEVAQNEFIIKELGADVVDGVMFNGEGNLKTHRIEYWQKYGEQIKEAYRKLLTEEYGLTAEQVQNVFDNMNTFGFLKLVRDAHLYRKNGRVTTKTEPDYKATNEAIRKAAGEDYKSWVDGLFKGIEEKSGIRNNADIFTSSGNRRSWEALHWENTLENVVRVMKQQDSTGSEAIFGVHKFFASATKDYQSIAEIKADKDRLHKISDGDYKAAKDEFENRLVNIATRIMDTTERNRFIAMDNALECIVDAVRHSKTKAGIYNELKQYGQLTVTKADVDDIISLVADIGNMPTGYFEAKPRRAVGFDEVGVFVIPYNADPKLKQELLNKGYSIAEYDPDVEGDRQKVVNSFEKYKFSLSDTNEATKKTYGSYNVYGKDIRLPGAEDIGPVVENAITTEEANYLPEDYAPIENSYTIEQEIAKIEKEIEALSDEGSRLYNNGDEAAAMEILERMNALGETHKQLTARRDALKAQEEAEHRAYMDSLTDADMPLEAEMAYGEADTTPLDDKTLKVLTRNVRNVLAARPKDNKAIREIIERYSTSGQSKSQLFRELREKFGTIYEYQRSELAEIKKDLLTYKFNVSDQVKSDIADWGDFRKNNSRVRTSKDALSVDQLYEELSGKYPGVFSPEIANETDRFLRINEVANTPAAQWVAIGELSDNEIMQAVDIIYNEVNKYRNNTIRKAVEADARAYIDDIAPSRAKEITDAPIGDTAPRYQEINSRLEQNKATLAEEFEQKKAQMQSDLADENTFISRKAKELYNEIRSLKKGVRASKELGYILDHGFEWKSIKTALINAMNSPGKRVNQNSAAEGVVREMLHELYEDSVYELSDMDNEYQRQSAKLEAKAEKERGNVQIKTVKERLAEKLANVEKELADNKQLRADSIVDFNREIARLQEEYSAKENKNTKAANNILRRIERYQTMKNNVDADYEKRISDLEARKAKISEEVRTGQSATEQGIMRAELHLSKIENIRDKFAERGLDFDKVLKNAKNLSTFATVDNTPQRVMEKALGYREGQILADETVNKVAQNETEGIKWLNSYTDRKNGLLAKISRQYNIKPGSKESAAAQMYAEGFYVNKDNEIIKYGDNELAADFPDATVRANIKGLANDTRIRRIYDETLDMINESRARNAYPEIQKLDNYFLHFRAMDDTFSRLGLPFNPNDIKAKDLPTDLNGVTADLKPGQPYFASSLHREGIRTSYDLLGGLERYLSSAKNQIYHIDDIQTLRALRNHIANTYGQANGLDGLDALSEEEVQERIKQVFGSHLSTFAKFLNEEANIIAGKTALIDRGLEGIIGRRGITFLDTINKQVGANMVGFNVSSSLTNVLPVVQAFAKTNKTAFVKGFAQTVSNKLGSITGNTDGFAESSPVVIRRKGADRFYRTPYQKLGDAGYVLMSAVDDISTEIIARAKYNELTAKGMSADQAHVETDKWVSRLMGDRSLGQMPQLYNSKMLGLITKFQLEVRNQLDSQFYDTIQEAKADNADIENALARNSKTAAKVALTFTELAIAQHLFGKAFESIAGYNPAFDIISVIATALGFDDDEESEDTALDNIEQGFLALLEDLPYTSTFTGGRIPISSALPIEELIKGEDQYGNEIDRLALLGETAPYYVLPGGYGQAKKTIQGLSMFSDEHPIAGSYTDSGNLRFPVDDTLANRVQAGIFGQWASDNARDYFDNERAPLNEKQTQEFIDVGMTIQDYWDYREGLSQYKTLAEKADYINGLDLTVEQKNVLINNIADREEDIDMSDYGNYGSFEEFDYANKYPEKYEFWKQNGISYEDYASADEDTKAAYNWAFEYPDKFTLSKAVASDVVTYRQYTSALNDIKADKDEDGKSITGSRKEKVIDYINNLDADYGSKIILFKSEYPADDTYNYDIIDYLNSRDDISYKEMETILKELGFSVDKNGNITWD